MAILSSTDRAELWQDFMAELSRTRTPIGGLTKNALLAALAAVDDWVDANAISFNLAIPNGAGARAILTAKQKAQLLMFVVRRRFEVT